MGTIRVEAGAAVAAPSERVFACLSDYREHRSGFLPDAFTEFAVEEGGSGAGTVYRYRMITPRRQRVFRMKVDVPEAGKVIRETDLDSTLVSTITVHPDGESSRVAIETTWKGAGGIRGFFERLFAPGALRKMYAQELERLGAYAAALADA